MSEMATQGAPTEVPDNYQITHIDSKHKWRGTLRPRVLANSAVEFMENQPGKAFGPEIADKIGQPPQYAPQFDRFIAESNYPHENYFKESQEKSARFKEILSNFCKTLKKQKLDHKLDIQLKEPESYSLQDVMDIVRRLQERKQQSENTQGCLGKIRKCFKRALDERGVLISMLNFVPNDSYGAMISGGFTVILAAVDRNESLREEVHSALAEIPKKLQQVETLLKVHYQSPKLKSEADWIIVEVFGVLEAIISELSRSMTSRTTSILLRGDQHAIGITTAITKFQQAIERFASEASVCDSKRLGDIHEHVVRSSHAMEGIQRKLQDNYELHSTNQAEIVEIGQGVLREIQKQGNVIQEGARAIEQQLYDTMYAVFAGSPFFDRRSGRREYYRYCFTHKTGIT